MANVALFDVVIPAVIGWVLIDDLMRSLRDPVRIKSMVNNVVSMKQGALKARGRSAAAVNLAVTQNLPVIEEQRETCSAC